jgi:Rps23 Pro-64 3,4-dihydroxylase Tpa1-like proline 4-hydroxylase
MRSTLIRTASRQATRTRACCAHQPITQPGKYLLKNNCLSSAAPRFTKQQTRLFSYQAPAPLDPIIDTVELSHALSQLAPEISASLSEHGYYTTSSPFLPRGVIEAMRQQSINLRKEERFESSWSEKIDEATGQATRFDKEGVFACEPDGSDYDTAPDLITYMSVLLQTLPPFLNGEEPTNELDLSVASFNAKLAVTSPGGSVYPLHIDNPQGLAVGDTRKLTCIIYLNPDYKDQDGGELRILLGGEEGLQTIDIPPSGGRLLLFWSDEIPHEVLPMAPDADVEDEHLDRYALTIWIPTENIRNIHNPNTKWARLRDDAFP